MKSRNLVLAFLAAGLGSLVTGAVPRDVQAPPAKIQLSQFGKRAKQKAQRRTSRPKQTSSKGKRRKRIGVSNKGHHNHARYLKREKNRRRAAKGV
jgi:hypothetical protein